MIRINSVTLLGGVALAAFATPAFGAQQPGGTDVVPPPMGAHNTNTVLARSNFVFGMLWEGGIDRDDEIATSIGTKLALQPWIALGADARKLLAAIDERFFGGAMPAGVKGAIYDALVQIDDAGERARTALFLATTAFQFQVSR